MFQIKLKQKNNSYITQGGFTLIESLVAITILITAILGPMSIAANGIASAGYVRDQTTAFFLAQEGLEYVRNMRDSNALTTPPLDWLAGLSACVSSSCTINPSNNIINACTGTCPAVRYDSTSNMYGYAAGSETNFTRTISITTSVADREVVVSSTVTWKRGALGERSTTVEETLFNWHK